MKKAFTGLILGICCWAVAAASHAETKYALCVGINKYTLSGCSELNGCVNDSAYFYTNLVERGGWQTANMTKLNDSKATKTAIRQAISNYAAKAKSGDVFVYQHSSHGNSGLICSYNAEYKKAELATDLRSFESGVKVVMVVDACYSGSLFKDRAALKAFLDNWDFAGEVSREMDAQRASAIARGVKGADKALESSEIGWVTAASASETSIDFGFYDTDMWLTDPTNEVGDAISGTFLGSATWGWWKGTADTSSVGDKDGYCDPLEFWKIGYDFCRNLDSFWGESGYSYTPQHTNDNVLRSVELGWVGDEEPGGVRFASIPAQTAIVGQTLNYTVSATNSDGSTGAIKYSVTSSTAPSGSFSVNATSGAFSFTPAADGVFSFTFVGTNSTAHTGGKTTMTVTASLAAPSGLANSGVSSDSFTANWGTVAGATSYFLEVFAADPDASAAAKASSDAFELVTSADGLTAGEYLILAATNNRAMDNSFVGNSSGVFSCEDVTVENSAVSTEDAGIVWTLEGDASACTLFNADAGKYVNPSAARACGWSDTASGSWKLSLSGGLVSVANAASTSWRLQYNASSPRFAMYEGSGQDLRFFRRDGASGAVFSADVGNVTSYTVTDLIPGDYMWRVRAIGNDKGPFSETQEVTLFSDPSAPPSIRPVADIEITVGETATATVVVSTPETVPVTSLTITAGDAAAKLGEDGVFTFAPEAPGVYPFTITAVNSNDSASVSFSVTATLAAPVAAEATEVGSDSFTANWSAVAGAQSYLLTVVEGAASPSGGAVTDTLTAEGFGLGSRYGEGTCDSEASGAKYAAYAMKNGTAIQIKSKDSVSGIVVTDSAGAVSEVRVRFETTTQAPRTLNVYGSSKAYSSAADLYSDSTAGDLLGTIVYDGSSTEGSLAIKSPCAFIGLRSAANAIYLDSVEIDWNGSSKAARAEGDLVLDAEDVGDATSYPVTGLSPLTHYSYFVAAKAGDILSSNSGTVELTTTDGPAAPAWSEIPSQTATAGVEFSLDLAPYVSGSPAPALSADVGTIAGTVLTWTPDAAGSFSIALTAENGSGTVETALAVDVGLAAPVAADATNVGATSFTANWSAVAGAESYLLTVVEGKGAPSGDAVTDTLTADGLGLGSSYGDGSYVSTASGAEYAAHAMKKSGGTAIQINGKNNIGIVATVSGGTVSEIRVIYETKTANTINVYGSSTAYSSAADLYSSSTAGTLLGTITCDDATSTGSLAIDGSYAFVGLRSASGAIYLDSIEIDWNGSGSSKAARAEGDLVLDAEDVGNVTSYPVTGLSMLTQYSYTVAAKAGAVVSEASEAISATTLESEVAPVWSEIPEQSATLGEPFVFDFAAYLVANPAATVTASAGTVDGTVLTFTPDAVGPTTITLTAVNTLDSAATTVVVVAVPAAPEAVEPTVVSSNSFVATWLEVEGAQKYHLVVVEAAPASSAARAAGDVVFEGDVTGTSYEVTGLAPETDYSYTVAAIVDGVAGPASEPVAVTTKAGPSAPAWSAIPAQNTYVGATFQLDLSAFLSGNPEPTVTADVGTVTGLNYVYVPEATGPVTVTLTAVNESGSKTASFVLTVSEAPTGGTHYAVVVGCNNYATGYASSLKGAVPDANHVYSLITTRGAWETANVTKLTDSAAKHDAIRAAISNAAANAVAGDTFLYFQSSHGGNWSYTFVTNDAPYADYPTIVYGLDPAGEDNFICSYNANYTAAEMAADLAAFDPAVNVVVMLDTCHSAGMFKYDASRGVRRRAPATGLLSASPDLFAEAVAAQLGAIRRARGIRAPSNVGFVTAADFNEYSWDSQDGNGGEFTTAFIDGVTNGVCDNAEYGDQDGWATFYEGWNYAKDIALGCVNDPEVDENGYALYDNTAYAEEYNEPDYYYDYNFTHAQITNEPVLRAVRVGYAGNPTLAAPVANPAEDVTDSSFTASWSSVADATGYRLQVATDESFSTGAASDELVAADFEATGTSYTDFSGVTKPSGAVYAGKTAKNSGAIQLNDSKSAGIWTTASGGNVSRVAVVWNTSPASGRSVKVYGSDSPLTSYSAASAATLVGTLTASVTSLNVTNTYAYVGILPSGGAIYLDTVTIDWGTADSESSIVLDQNVGKVTSHSVTGLEADTDYYYRVQALGGPVDSDFSNVISLTTEGGTPAAPAWDTIPPQSVVAGQDLVLDLNPYVSGSPKPTITADAGTVEAGVLTVSFAEAGGYTVTVTAENTEGTKTATIAVTVTAAPVTVPGLTLSNASDTTFDAEWTECTDATSYQLQVATDDQFSTGSAAGKVTLFNNTATNPATVPEGWTYAVADTTSKYLKLLTDNSVVSATVSTKGFSSLTLTFKARSFGAVSNNSSDVLVEYTTDKGTTWNPLQTVTPASASLVNQTVDAAACIGNAEVAFRWSAPNATSSVGAGISTLVLSGEGTGGDGSLVLDTTTSGINYTVVDLTPETLYYARVRMADGEWSAVEHITTTEAGGEPVEVDIAEVTIDSDNHTLSFEKPDGAVVMTTTDLVNGPWVEYEGEWPIPMTGDAAFFRIGNPTERN